MKTFNIALLSVAFLGGVFAAADAEARGRHHHHHRSRVGVGVFFGAPLYPYYHYPYSPYPRYYYPPTVVVPSAPVYIEQSTAPAAPVAAPEQGGTAYWYYCPDSQTYYPYVQQCASQWQQVIPQASVTQ